MARLAVQATAEDQPLRLVQTGGAVAFSIVRITPDMAAGLLAQKRAGAQRNAGAVAVYAQSMRAGEWVLNGMPVIQSRTGVLLDGVQRLQACIEAQTPFLTVFADGVSDDTLHTIDQQRRRSFAGVLESRGVRHAAAVAGALAKLIRYDDDTLTAGTSTPPWSRMERALEANRPALEAAVKFSFDSPARLLAESIRTPLCFMGLQVDHHSIRRLLDAIARPERFAADEPGVMLRRRLVEGRADHAHRLTPLALFAVSIKALNDTITGARSEAYTWSETPRREARERGARPEPFPRLENYRGLADPVRGTPGQSRLAAAAQATLARPEACTMTLETITPGRAEEYLAQNRGNRNIVQSHVAAMARDIAGGHWMFNAQPICFARDGTLLNGQHRLSAVVEAGQPIEVLVMRGLPEAAFETYDKQAKKAPTLDGEVEAFGDKALLSAAAVLLWRREKRPAGQAGARPTATEVREVIRAHPELLRLRGFARKMLRHGRASALMYAGWRILQDDADLGQVFLDRLETAANLPAGHLILRLRDRLIDLRKADQEVQVNEILAAWAKFRKKPNLPLPNLPL